MSSLAGRPKLLVIGECGTGKSTMVALLRAPTETRSPQCGKSPHGVTKDISAYDCQAAGGAPFTLIDTPGIGDHSVTPAQLVQKIDDFMKSVSAGEVHGVVVTHKIVNNRLGLGARVVQAIVDKGFVAAQGGDKYANIILAGTMADRAEDEDMDNFMSGPRSLREAFFASSPDPTRGKAVMIHKGDYRPLAEAIRSLPAADIGFRCLQGHELAAPAVGNLPRGMSTLQEAMAQQQAELEELQRQMELKEQQRRNERRRREEEYEEAQRRLREDRERREREEEELREELARQQERLAEQRRRQAMEGEVSFYDSDGDRIQMRIESGRLIKFVNGRRQCGGNDFSGIVTRLKFSGRRRVDDQHGWGGDVPNESLLRQIADLASRAGVSHNFVPESVQVRCHPHPLRRFDNGSTTWYCDNQCGLCMRRVEGPRVRWSCRECGYDMCRGCIMHWRQAGNSQDARCDAGHKVVPDRRSSNICDRCGKTGTAYRCPSGCDYDLCSACFAGAEEASDVDSESSSDSEVAYRDSDGDHIKMCIESGRLIKYVNGRRQCGSGDRSGIVTRLRFSGRRRLDDQHGWGGDVPNSTVLGHIAALADRVGVPHNIG